MAPKTTKPRPVGRPLTTRSSKRPPIFFRAPSARAYDRFKAEADRQGLSVGQLACSLVFGGAE